MKNSRWCIYCCMPMKKKTSHFCKVLIIRWSIPESNRWPLDCQRWVHACKRLIVNKLVLLEKSKKRRKTHVGLVTGGIFQYNAGMFKPRFPMGCQCFLTGLYIQLPGKFATDFARKLYIRYLLPGHKVNATEELKTVVSVQPLNKFFVGTFTVRF